MTGRSMRMLLATIGLASLAVPSARAADPVGTWDIAGKVVATACGAGRCATRVKRSRGTLIITADGRYREPADITTCSEAPDEVGTWQPGPRGRFVLEPGNIPELEDAAERCTGIRLVVTRDRAWVKPSADGTSLVGSERLSAHARYHGTYVTAQAVARFRGTPQVGSNASTSADRIPGRLLPSVVGAIGDHGARAAAAAGD